MAIKKQPTPSAKKVALPKASSQQAMTYQKNPATKAKPNFVPSPGVMYNEYSITRFERNPEGRLRQVQPTKQDSAMVQKIKANAAKKAAAPKSKLKSNVR